jgi:hypothetical protein
MTTIGRMRMAVVWTKTSKHTNMDKGWKGVDLDGTLAHYDTWQRWDHIGLPIPLMVERVKGWLLHGEQVRIVTARVSPIALELSHITLEDATKVIQEWCLQHIGAILPITHEKDIFMTELWDDRCVQVVPNTGRRADGRAA